MSAPITDHPYRPDRAGQWFTGRCDKCGEARTTHAPVDPARCPVCGNTADVCLCPDLDECERCQRSRELHPAWSRAELSTVHHVNNHDGTNPERKWPGE